MYITEEFNNKLMESIKNSPLVLLAITTEESIKTINDILPYSVGMEFECYNKSNYIESHFELIPNIIHIQNDSSEKRFRIQHGINGILSLYSICDRMAHNCFLAENSAIHYHIDFTDVWRYINIDFINIHKFWILEQFDKWNTADPEKSRDVRLDNRCWVNFQSPFKTMEVRIGECSFDYKVIINRIIDCNRIAKELKCKIIGNNKVLENIEKTYYDFDPNPIIEYLDINYKYLSELELINEKEKMLKIEKQELLKNEKQDSIVPEDIVLNRVIKRT